MLGNTLTSKITGYPSVTDTRITMPPPPESDDDFIDRHCRHVYNVVHGITPAVTDLTCVELPVEATRGFGQSDEAFVAAYCAALQAAV